VGSLLAIDPGKKALGWSAWAAGELLSAGIARLPRGFRLQGEASLGAQAVELASQVPTGAEEAVVERMVQYPTRGRRDSVQRQDALANDLLDLQAIGGIVAARCVTGGIYFATPHEWKGELPKEVVILRVRNLLSEGEAKTLEGALEDIPASLRHNALEAVGLGLWRLKRWKR
jgi:hypothetical protein